MSAEELGMGLVHRLGWAAPRVFVTRSVTSGARRQGIAAPVTNPRHYQGARLALLHYLNNKMRGKP